MIRGNVVYEFYMEKKIGVENHSFMQLINQRYWKSQRYERSGNRMLLNFSKCALIDLLFCVCKIFQSKRQNVYHFHIKEALNTCLSVELKAEIDRLRSQSGVMNEDQQSASLAEISALKEKLAVREKEMEEMTRYIVYSHSSYRVISL